MGTAVAAQQPQTASVRSEAQRPAPPRQEHLDSASAANALLLSCLNALANGRPGKAEQLCGKALDLDPHSSTGYKLRGYAYLIEQRFERAAEDFRAALRFRPDDAESHAGYGRSLNGLGQFGLAVAEFSWAVSLSPLSAAYHNGLCWARAGTGRNLRTALGDCNRALMLAPGTPGPLNSRGLVHLRLGRLKEAIADYDTSLTAKAFQPSARFGRGLARLRLHRTVSGVLDITEARRMDSQIDELFIGLGILRRACVSGDREGPNCPPGFPSRPEHKAPSYPWLMARVYAGPEQGFALPAQIKRLNIRRSSAD
ncbi:MAG TPA: tetratricopeptide repeat protein [Rhizomicrobium sp.]|nr:tetratricopeptide repeat protein [Rhizomicrobium sp.]